MANSIVYIYPKEEAIRKIRLILKENGLSIADEKEINSGLGYKFTCFSSAKKFSLVLYFKSGMSSKIVFENTPNEIQELFCSPANDDTTSLDNSPTIQIHAPFKIHSPENQEAIHKRIHEIFNIVDETVPKSTILYKAKIEKGNYKLTLTQFINGTLLIQGLDSPLVTNILEIIEGINPITDKEKALLYVPETEQQEVQKALSQVPEVFVGLYEEAKSKISTEAFNFLFDNDKQTLVSAIGILKAVKETGIKIPLYNPILYPFAKVFEGFMIKLMIEKSFFTFEEYQRNPNIAKIGNALRNYKFKKYIKDVARDENVLDKLKIAWESIRCHELHSDPAQNSNISNLDDIQQVENRIGEISAAIMDGFRILVRYGYSEKELFANKVANKTNTTSNIEIKEIPNFTSHIGTDESGKGDYFGPLVIAGVFVDLEDEKKLLSIGVQDSKKNSDLKNRELAQSIKKILSRDKISIVYIMPEKYNELYSKMKNLNAILAWGHARAIENILVYNSCENVIADQFGDESYIKKALLEKGKKVNLLQTPKAERDIAVATASILARDKYLEELDKLQMSIGLNLYRGASTQVEAVARQIIKKFGETVLHKYAKMHFKTTEKVKNDRT